MEDPDALAHGPAGPVDRHGSRMIELVSEPDLALLRLHAGVTAGMASSLRDAIGWAVDHHRGVVVDLAGAPTIDPIGLGVLVSAQRRARARNGAVCLVAPAPFVRAVVRSMGVERLFPTFVDCHAARAWLSGTATTPAPAARS